MTDEFFLDHDEARLHLRTLVHRILRDEYGPDAVIRAPIAPGWKSEIDKPADPVLAIGVARRLAATAERMAIEYACEARGKGESWLTVATAFGAGSEFDNNGEAMEEAEAVFRRVAGPHHRPDQFVYWDCATCQQRITDAGPYDQHPDDQEAGHAPDCARHNAAVAGWKGNG